MRIRPWPHEQLIWATPLKHVLSRDLQARSQRAENRMGIASFQTSHAGWRRPSRKRRNRRDDRTACDRSRASPALPMNRQRQRPAHASIRGVAACQGHPGLIFPYGDRHPGPEIRKTNRLSGPKDAVSVSGQPSSAANRLKPATSIPDPAARRHAHHSVVKSWPPICTIATKC